jgi:D-alanine-D-alanine ligase-like ATP-grasp enzyme
MMNTLPHTEVVTPPKKTTGAPVVQLLQYAAGNIFDKQPVALIDASAVESKSLAARIPWAWDSACRLLLVSSSNNQISPPGFSGDVEAALLIAEFARSLRQLCGLDQGRLIQLKNDKGDHIAGIAAAELAANKIALRAAALLLVQAAVSDTVRNDIAALRYEAWLRKGTWASAVAARLGIPWSIVASTSNPFVVLGQGYHRRLFWRHMVGASGALGTKLAEDKRLSSEALRRANLPAPPQRTAADVKDALSFAKTLGWPVVVKPVDSGGGKGVTAGIDDERELVDAFERAKIYGPVVVEKHIEGYHHRITVIRGQCVSALRFEPAHIVGDGYRNVSELLAEVNATRTEELSRAWKKIKLDDNSLAMLRRQELSLDSVPIAGQKVALRSQSNLSSGGTYTDVTVFLHPDTRRLAETAARLFDIEICGVDFITPDASKSWLDVGGGINEVNRNPSYLLGDDETKWADKIVGGWFPDPERGRIPVVVVLYKQQDDGRAELLRAVATILHEDATKVAIASSDAVRFGDIRSKASGPLPQQVEAALADPIAAALVIQATPDEIIRLGLGLEICDAVVVSPGLADEHARAVAALAQLSPIVVLTPCSPPTLIAASQGARLYRAESSDNTALVSALSNAMRIREISDASPPPEP